jgi:predicted metalloprotease with PDZ domain
MGDVRDHKKIDWFREGFTQYYGYLLVHRAGLMPLLNYVDGINHDLRNYHGSHGPYIRGRIIALWLDSRIRKDSEHKNSLDDMMFDMVREAAKPLTERRILQTAGRYLAPDSRIQLGRIVKGGAEIAPEDDALGSCAHASMVELATFDLGFDFAASRKANKVVGVRPDSPASRAGLRDGQALLGWSVYDNEPGRAAKFTILTDEGETTTIEYFPKGKTITVPQYHLDEACRTRN